MTGDERVAVYSKKFHQLEYWEDHSSTRFVNCDSMEQARAIVKASKVAQKLTTR